MKCPKCGTDNPQKGNYCINCGEKLELKYLCPQCKKQVPESSNFCIYCGGKIKGKSVVQSTASRTVSRGQKIRRGTGTYAKRPSSKQSKNTRVVALTLVIVLVLVAGGVSTLFLIPRSRDLNTGAGANLVWAAEVQEIASNFNCPCGECGITPLEICTCDAPRGAVETKRYIQNLLNQGLAKEEIIQKFEDKYGNRILASQ
jgi:cytochrome c-type biogenesis protein CcmH/NrfF